MLHRDGQRATQKRNGVAREFEASGHTVLLAGTSTLNRGVTINGANHVIILNTEWSPEMTLQAEDRCHRPGQTRDVFVHYILSANTMEEQMWELLNQKAAAQRAVFDKEALYKSVEEVMAEAVSAQMQVAKAVIEIEREVVSVQPSVVRVQLVTILDAQLTTRSQPQTCRFRPKVIRRRGTTRAKWPLSETRRAGQANTQAQAGDSAGTTTVTVLDAGGNGLSARHRGFPRMRGSPFLFDNQCYLSIVAGS